MIIVRVMHFELDRKEREELFISQEVAEEHVKDWKVTNWGKLYFKDLEVTE
jgi:hypothetical protein